MRACEQRVRERGKLPVEFKFDAEPDYFCLL